MAVVNGAQKPSMFLGTFELKEVSNGTIISSDSVRHLKHGGRVVLPSSVLRRIVAVDAPSPFIIKIQMVNSKTDTFCGVQSFEGKEREVMVPQWMCDRLKAPKNTRVKVFILIRRLATGTLAKFKPLSVDFFNVMNPKQVLEGSLSHYTCLNVNNTIDIKFIDRVYKMAIVHLEPETLVDITNCDLEVQFEVIEEKEVEEEDHSQPFIAFSGECNRLNGAALEEPQKKANELTRSLSRKSSRPDFKYELGTLKLQRKETTADKMYSKLKKQSKEGEKTVGKRRSTRITLRKSATETTVNSEPAVTPTASKKRKTDTTSTNQTNDNQ